MTYPAAVLVVAFVVTIILMVFVIPAFEDLFKGFGADLPAFTRLVIEMSQFIRDKGWVLAMMGGAAGYAFMYFKKRSRPMRHFLDRMALNMPIIGPIIQKAAIARYARTLSTMFSHWSNHSEGSDRPLRTYAVDRSPPAYRWLKHWNRLQAPPATSSMRLVFCK